jgi:hypothetical protein
MKINKKALRLIDKGLSANTVSKLDESQIDVLYSKLVVEQTKATTAVSSKNPSAAEIAKNLNSQGVNVTMTEKEVSEDIDVDLTKDPDATDDGMGIFEKENEDSKSNPWAICHSQVGPKKSRKWERCVREIKKQLKEGKNPVSLFLENEIMKIVEKNIPPRITKGDLIKYLSEAGPSTAPSKPKTSPTTKPGTPDKRPRPSHPGKNPNPGEKESPKAKNVSADSAKDKVIDLIMNLLEK